jgi:hypothetical protein
MRGKYNNSTEAVFVQSNFGYFIREITINKWSLLHIHIDNFPFITISCFAKDIFVEEGNNSFSSLNKNLPLLVIA